MPMSNSSRGSDAWNPNMAVAGLGEQKWHVGRGGSACSGSGLLGVVVDGSLILVTAVSVECVAH